QHCLQQLERIARRERLPEPQGKVVVLLHGLGRTARSMQPLAEYLEEHGYETVCFSYASTRDNLLEHAKALRRVVDSLQGASSISLVGHSLGNLVVRRCLAEADEGWVEQRKLYRMV